MTTPNTHQFKLLKRVIYAYVFFLFFEGAFRKWITPGLNYVFLLVRDPIVVLVYLLAAKERCIPSNTFISSAVVLGVFSFLLGILSEHSDLFITLYGLRINYLQIPFIFILPKVLNREDVYQLGKLIMWSALPMTLVLIYQFYSPQTHWINLGPGGVFTQGLTGGNGRFRSSGTFSFISGLAAFYPLVLAFLMSYLVDHRKVSFRFLGSIGVCVVLAIPCSMSRQLALTAAIVMVAAFYVMYKKKEASKLIMRLMVIGTVLIAIASLFPAFDEGIDSFTDRWESATGDDVEGFNKAILDRFSSSFTGSADVFSSISITGVGVGMGSNVAAQRLTGSIGFLLAEDEWSRIILELGPMLGSAFILFRFMLFVHVLKSALQAMKQGNGLPLLIFSSLGLLVLNGQWAPPMILGFAIIGAGLSLAACNPPNETMDQKKRRRQFVTQVMNPQYGVPTKNKRQRR